MWLQEHKVMSGFVHEFWNFKFRSLHLSRVHFTNCDIPHSYLRSFNKLIYTSEQYQTVKHKYLDIL